MLAAFLLAVVVGLLAVGWVYGRGMFGNSLAAVDLARLSGKVPEWTVYGVPVLALLVMALVALYLAFGRHVALKLIGLVVVIGALAAPGLALGWVNGTVSTVSDRSDGVKDVVAKAEKELRPALPGEAVNILLIGRDESVPGDPGRSDTQILVRLDPDSKSISMLSVPRDLRVDIPGVGIDKMNAAYFHGGPALVVETFSTLTGLPVNHFVEVDFAGFWHAVNILGGVYIPVDKRYYNPESSSYKSIDIMPGYQLMRGHDALDFVRFRRDESGDFGRMQRQQLFLKEAQRQSGRWSADWTKVVQLIQAITAETTSDINSLKRLQPLVELVFQVDTSDVHTTHIEGMTPTIDGVSYVVPTQQEIDEAVAEFTNPTASPEPQAGEKVDKEMYTVTVSNASGIDGHADPAEDQLGALGYRVVSGPDSPDFPGTTNMVYTSKSLAGQARALAAMIEPSTVEVVDRTPGSAEGIRIFITSSFRGALTVPQVEEQPRQTLLKDQNVDQAAWQALAQKSPLPLEMPSSWIAGSAYDEFRAYRLTDTKGRHSAAAVVVARTPGGGSWSIQTMRWLTPPAIENPNGKRMINGTEYLLFYQGDRLHMVAWKRNKTLYWVLNTLKNELTDDTMMNLAKSFKPVQ